MQSYPQIYFFFLFDLLDCDWVYAVPWSNKENHTIRNFAQNNATPSFKINFNTLIFFIRTHYINGEQEFLVYA